MHFGIAAFPHKNVQDSVNAYRKRYDPHYTLIAPHITLKEKFTLSEDEVGSIVPTLNQIAADTVPFTTTLNKVSHFHPTSSTIYLAVKDPTPLRELHHKISQSFPMEDLPYEFIPHLTIGQKMKEDELYDVYGRLRMQEFDLSTFIDRFHLMYQLDNQSWNIYQTFVLSHTN